MTAPKEPVLPSPRPGDVLAGKYVLTRVLGEGGMGTVFAAHEETLGRDVAVKVLHPRGLRPETVFRGMRREARALAAVDHPNIVRVIEAGTTSDGVPFLVMELVHGKTLRLLSEHLGPIDVISTIAFGIQMGRALAAAHQRGVVHGDFKPDNVLVTPEARVKVGDFGLARHVEHGRLGTTDELVAGCGTPHYMAPELFLGRAASAASDIYALGATLIELLTGKHMFAVDSVELPTRVEVRRMHIEVEPEPIENICGPLVAPLGALVRSMVAKDPRERPTAREVVEGLRYEHLRLRRHFPENEEDSSDMEDDVSELKVPRAAPRGRPVPEVEPVSPRVRAFVTEPLPPSFVPSAALPFGRKRADLRNDARAVLRQKATDPMPAPAAPARPKATEPMPKAARVVPSGEAVTLPLAKRAAPPQAEASASRGPSRATPATVAAIGFACLSAALVGRDLLLKHREDEARTGTAPAAVTAGASASAAASNANPEPVPVAEPGSTASAPSGAPSSEPSAPRVPASVPRKALPSSNRGTPPKIAPPAATPSVVDPWAKPRRPAPGAAGLAPRATATAPSARSTRPLYDLPFGKEDD